MPKVGVLIDGTEARVPRPRPPSLRSAIAPFMVMEVMRAAAARERDGMRVIHLEVGQPGTPAPRVALEAVERALKLDTLGYTLALGMPTLRERIARHYQDMYGLHVPAERVVVTNGSSAAFVLAFLALFDPGDRVALVSPGYPCYRHILTALGVTPVLLPVDDSTRWMPTPAQISDADEANSLAGVLLASPANPTGTMLEAGRLSEIAGLCATRNIWFVSDEIYHGLTYGMAGQTALQHDDSVVINSFSKYFSMTGWRVGWMVVPERLVAAVERLAQNLYISPPAVAQVAALAAFDAGEELEANKRVYSANRALLLDGLPTAGFDRIVPADGAFYLYADVSALTDDSVAFCTAMLDEISVAVTPGVDFDEARGRRFVRFSYAGPTSEMAEAVERLQGWKRLR